MDTLFTTPFLRLLGSLSHAQAKDLAQEMADVHLRLAPRSDFSTAADIHAALLLGQDRYWQTMTAFDTVQSGPDPDIQTFLYTAGCAFAWTNTPSVAIRGMGGGRMAVLHRPGTHAPAHIPLGAKDAPLVPADIARDPAQLATFLADVDTFAPPHPTFSIGDTAHERLAHRWRCAARPLTEIRP